MTQKTIDLILNLDTNKTSTGAKKAVRSLQEIEQQANKTREKMEKLAQVGSKMALLGAGITAPFLLAMKKYVDTAKDTEPVSKRILELNKKWEESQTRLGKITAEIVLPTLEKAVVILDKVIAFAEKNPGVVQAALTIGTTLVVLGGLIATTAQLVSTVATIQGLAAGAGIALGGGGAAGGAIAGAASGAGLAALGTTIMAGLSAFWLNVGLPVTLLAIGGQIGLWIGNALSGQQRTWADIWETVKQLAFIVKMGWSQLIQAIFQSNVNLLSGIFSGLVNLGSYIVNGLRSWITGGKASGGYATSGIYRMGEKGREFVLNNQSTRNAERSIGGRLSQDRATAYVTNNMQIGNGMTIAQTRRLIHLNEKNIMGNLAGAFG